MIDTVNKQETADDILVEAESSVTNGDIKGFNAALIRARDEGLLSEAEVKLLRITAVLTVFSKSSS